MNISLLNRHFWAGVHAKNLAVFTAIMLTFACCFSQTCRTPSGRRVVFFEPGAYYPAPITYGACSIAVKTVKFSAFIGERTANPYLIHPRIEFIWHTATAVCLGYSIRFGTDFKLYEPNNPIAILTEWRGSNMVLPNNVPSHSMEQIYLRSEEAGRAIGELEVSSLENTFGVDNMMVFDVLYGGLNEVPENLHSIIRKIDAVMPGEGSSAHDIEVSNITDALLVMINWNEADGLEMGLDLSDPAGKTVYSELSADSPIILPTVHNPLMGSWLAKVLAFPMPGLEPRPYGIIVAVHEKPQIDCFFDGASDLKWYPDPPTLGEGIYINAEVHGASLQVQPIEAVRVRCYLGDPDAGIQIDKDDVCVNIEPGHTKIASFYFKTQMCEEVSPCQIFVVIDPETEVEEFNEDNNVVFREVIFAL
jgi:hypothetical protein